MNYSIFSRKRKLDPNTTIGQPCQTGNHASPTKPKTSLLCLTNGPIAKLGTISRNLKSKLFHLNNMGYVIFQMQPTKMYFAICNRAKHYKICRKKDEFSS
jgi:hypothetical protein